MAKDGSPNVTYADFEPFCQWKRLEGSDILEVHLPDFEKKELRVRASNCLLTISGERLTDNEAKKIQFCREIKLSRNILSDQIRAQFGDNVLSITMPKKASAGSAEVGKPIVDISEGEGSAENGNCKRNNFMSGLTSSLSRFEFSKEMGAVAVVILALGGYYLTKHLGGSCDNANIYLFDSGKGT